MIKKTTKPNMNNLLSKELKSFKDGKSLKEKKAISNSMMVISSIARKNRKNVLEITVKDLVEYVNENGYESFLKIHNVTQKTLEMLKKFLKQCE